MYAEKLIELVREFPVLYDLTHPKYSDSRTKERIWLRIAEKVKQPEVACKKTWSNLREAYRRALKRRKSASGLASGRKWKYEEEMSFLSVYYKERPKPTTVGVTSEDTEDTEDTILERDICKIVDTATPGTPNSSHSEPASPEHSPVSWKKRKVEETGITAATVMHYLIQNNKEKEADEIEQFCRCIGTMLRKFSPYDLAMAKKEIFSIISEMEFRQLRGSGTSSFTDHLKDENL